MRRARADAVPLEVPAPRQVPFAPVLHAFQAAVPPPTAAVDGSHAVLVDNGHLFVVAVRAAAVAWPGPPPHPRTTVVAAAAGQDVEAEYARRGLPAPRVRSAEGFAEAHRTLAEMDACLHAADSLPRGGLLLIDGALAQLPELAQAVADRVVDRGRARGVHVVGVSKRSGLAVQGVPVVPALLDHGQQALPGACWHASVPGHTARVALLHSRARHAFRIDGPEEALPWLAGLARDAVYLGYPYPLAKAHNAVAITRREARRLAERVQREAGAAVDDFHSVLDRNAPR